MWLVISLSWSYSTFVKTVFRRTIKPRPTALFATALLVCVGCSEKKQTPSPNYPQQHPAQPNYPTQYGTAPTQAPPGTYPTGQGPVGQPQWAQPSAVPGAVGATATSPAPTFPGFGQLIPFADTNPQLLSALANSVLAELVQALPAASQSRVRGIPLLIDGKPGEVNAFAACDEAGQSAMAITVGLLKISAVLATAQAHDERFGTKTVDAYIGTLASQLRSGQPVPVAPASLFPGVADPVVQQRRQVLLEEQVAFILGHELGHHHLSHLPCTAAPDPSGVDRAGRVLSNAVPLFNQPNEVAADLAGVANVLDAGKLRQTRAMTAWTEAGALLSMRFFSGLNQMSAGAVLTSFERSHPLPQFRTPILTHAATNWRNTGSVTGGLPIGGFGAHFAQPGGAHVDTTP